MLLGIDALPSVLLFWNVLLTFPFWGAKTAWQNSTPLSEKHNMHRIFQDLSGSFRTKPQQVSWHDMMRTGSLQGSGDHHGSPDHHWSFPKISQMGPPWTGHLTQPSSQDELLKKVCKLANALRAEGVKKGDRRGMMEWWNLLLRSSWNLTIKRRSIRYQQKPM